VVLRGIAVAAQVISPIPSHFSVCLSSLCNSRVPA